MSRRATTEVRMKIPFALAVALAASPCAAQVPSLFPSGYPDHAALSASLNRVAAEHPGRVRIRSLAKTAQGRDVWLVTLGKPDEPKPAILLVANLEADHVVGSAVATRLVEALAAD